MSSTHNVGVIGYGWAATAHIEAINNTTQGNVTAVYSSRELDPAKLSAAHGGEIKVYNKIEDLLADDSIDVVDITSYPTQHKDQAIAAAKAGKAVILEKPITLNLEDAEAIKAAFDANNTKSCVCFELRFISQFTTIKAILDEGLIGEVHYGEVDYYHGIGPWYGQFPWNVKKEMGTSSLATAGCHALDALLFFMGVNGPARVEEVTSYATRSSSEIFAPYEYPSTSSSLLRFEDGRVAKCASVVDCLQPYYFHVHLVGSHGSILDNKIYSHKLEGMNKDRWSELQTSLIDSGDVSDHPYRPQFQAFADATSKGEPMPRTDLKTAQETHRVMFAADLSATEGRSVNPSELGA